MQVHCALPIIDDTIAYRLLRKKKKKKQINSFSLNNWIAQKQKENVLKWMIATDALYKKTMADDNDGFWTKMKENTTKEQAISDRRKRTSKLHDKPNAP